MFDSFHTKEDWQQRDEQIQLLTSALMDARGEIAVLKEMNESLQTAAEEVRERHGTIVHRKDLEVSWLVGWLESMENGDFYCTNGILCVCASFE
jgi:hypothetical protein